MIPGWAALGGGAINTIIAQWFNRRRGLAASLALNGATCGGLLFAPAFAWAIDTLGFAKACIAASPWCWRPCGRWRAFALRPRRPDEHDAGDEPARVGRAGRHADEPRPAAQPAALSHDGRRLFAGPAGADQLHRPPGGVPRADARPEGGRLGRQRHRLVGAGRPVLGRPGDRPRRSPRRHLGEPRRADRRHDRAALRPRRCSVSISAASCSASASAI